MSTGKGQTTVLCLSSRVPPHKLFLVVVVRALERLEVAQRILLRPSSLHLSNIQRTLTFEATRS